VLLPIPLILKLAGATALRRIAVLALWKVAQESPGEVDDEIVREVAKSLGVELPVKPQGRRGT
jgi:hypothetical protein